jgi:hypothetical protein
MITNINKDYFTITISGGVDNLYDKISYCYPYQSVSLVC